MARELEHGASHVETANVRGTHGFMDPLYASTGQVTSARPPDCMLLPALLIAFTALPSACFTGRLTRGAGALQVAEADYRKLQT